MSNGRWVSAPSDNVRPIAGQLHGVQLGIVSPLRCDASPAVTGYQIQPPTLPLPRRGTRRRTKKAKTAAD